MQNIDELIKNNPVKVLQGMIKTMLSVPARADTSLLDEADTEIEIVKLAYKKARQKFANQPFVQVEIISDKSIVLVGWQGVKHALSDKSNVVKALASTCVVDLIVKANFVKVLEDKHNGSKPDILQTLLYSSKMDAGEKAGQFDIGLVIREYRDGRKIYDFFTTNSGSENPASISGGNETVQPLAGHTYNINNQSLIVKGRTNTVKTAKGTKIDTVFAVVEAEKVIASHTATGATNPNYPQELQPRDRSRDASVAWVQKTANNLDPDSLGRTGRADTGAPIVGSDLCVESGNGRTMAIQLAYARGNAEEYRDWLIDEAEYFGFDREEVEALQQPVLVRIRTTPIDRVQFAIEANQDDKLSQSATERARSDAKLLDDNLLSLFNPNDNGDLMAAQNQKFLSGFMSKLGITESAQYADKNGNFTQSFITRLKQAVFAKAYNDDRLIDMMADQANPDLKNMLNSLTAAAPHFIKAQAVDKIKTEQLAEGMVDGMEKTLNQQVLDAINYATDNILHAKNMNQDIAEYVSQQGLFEDVPEGVAELTVYIAQHIRSPKKLSELFVEMAKYIEQQELHSKNLGLFGDPEPLGVLDVFLYAKNAIEQDYGLFDDMGSNALFVTPDNAVDVLQNMIRVLSRETVEASAGEPVSLSQDQTDGEFLNGLIHGSIERSLEAIKRCDKIALSGTEYNDELEEVYKQYLDDLVALPLSELFGEIHAILPKLKNKTFKNETSFNLLYAVYAFQYVAGQWHTTKKGRHICGFIVDVPSSKKPIIDEIDPYTFKKSGGFFVRFSHVHEIPDKLLDDNQLSAKEVTKYVYGHYSSVEQIGGIRRHTGRPTPVDDESGTPESMAGGTGQSDGASRNQQFGNRGVSESDGTGALVGRNQSDEYGSGGGERTADTTTGGERGGSSESSGGGSAAERKRDRRTVRTAQQNAIVLEGKALDQHEVNNATLKEWANADEIAAQLPYLQAPQQGDVLKAEQRLMQDNGNGILFTNGTGTGKTYTGLGTVKRFLNAGKQNILLVTMNDKIIKDFIKSALPLDIEIYQLDGIGDNGGDDHNVVMTTYANFGQNQSLGKKDWDLIVVDEAHNLMQSSNGTPTAALNKLHALTGHHQGFNEWARMRFSETYPDPEMYNMEEEGESDRYQADLNNWTESIKPHRQQWIENWENQSQGRAKVVFLSATPFSYVFSIDWAEGYLFNFKEPKDQYVSTESGGYNSGHARDRFYMRNFGYRMRYNRLTQPDKDVDVGVMERMFNEQLKKNGALSGREIEVDFDYDRKFIMVESAVGKLIDEGLDYLSDARDSNSRPIYPALSRAVRKRFDYLSRRRLLEAIKAVEIIPYIKKSLALGRKVVIFHDYNEGGGFSPFMFDKADLANIYTNGKFVEFEKSKAEYERLCRERPDLVNLKLDYHSPLHTLKQALPKALVFNGTVSKGKRQQAVDLFNADDSGFDVMIVQSDAGATGISLHDVTGNRQRVSINIGQPAKPAKLRQTEGRIYRIGQASNAIQRYVTTGTNWERYAFAQTIAGRAETVDNLAMGQQAQVSIKQALIEAYMAAAPEEPSENDGVGGKAYEEENKRINSLSPFDQALTFYYAKGKNNDKRDYREGVDWYATPEPIGLKMIEWAGVHKGDKVLEPSAGDGAIGRFVPDTASLTMIEPTESLASRAQMANTGANVVIDMFENLDIGNKYHAIVMNPPFGHAGSTAIQHIQKAFQHLYDGGRIVALIPTGAMDEKLENWLQNTKNAYQVSNILLPACTFQNAGTKVMTRVVIIERHDAHENAPYDMGTRDYSGCTDIKQLFDAVRHATVTPRSLRIDEQLEQYGLYVRTERSKYVYNGDGLNNTEIRKAIEGGFRYHYRYNEFDEMVFSTNRSKSIIKHLQDTEQKLGVSLKVSIQEAGFDGLFDVNQFMELQPDVEYVVRRGKVVMRYAI